MTLKLKPQPLPHEITLPTSKSYANRLLIVAARLGGGRRLRSLPPSDDVRYLLNAFKEIGLNIETKSETVIFPHSFPECENSGSEPLRLHVGEGGTTARFLLSLLSLGKRKYVLEMEGRLAQRPWSGLVDILRAAGAEIQWESTNSLSIQGPVQLDRLPRMVTCKETTQFITSLQLSFFKEGLVFEPVELAASEAYWRMTLDCISDFKERSVPQDWSSASYPMVLAALKRQKVLFRDLHPDALQADSIVMEILKERGAAQEIDQGVMVNELKSFHPLHVNGSQCLDLIPTLVVLALRLHGVSRITHVKGLTVKESDRLAEIIRLVKAMGGKIAQGEEDSLIVEGPHQGSEQDLDPVADHRMVMMAALLLLMNEGGTLTNEQAITKSFPNFFETVAPTRK